MKFKQIPLALRLPPSLVFGLVAGFVIGHGGMGILFLLALFAGTAVLSVGLRSSRLLVAFAVWLGQYLVFYLRFPEPASPEPAASAVILIIKQIFVFLPATAITTGAYIGLLVEKMSQITTDRAPRDPAK